MASKTDSISNTPSGESRHLSRPAIIGISIGAPLGLIAIALLLWSARRHRRNRANTTLVVCSPPNPIDRSTIRVIPNADIEATPAFTTHFQNEPVELEDSAVVPTTYQGSQMNEPEGTSVYSNRVSAITTDENNRWSAVSSLRSIWQPSRLKATARTAEVGPAATDM